MPGIAKRHNERPNEAGSYVEQTSDALNFIECNPCTSCGIDTKAQFSSLDEFRDGYFFLLAMFQVPTPGKNYVDDGEVASLVQTLHCIARTTLV